MLGSQQSFERIKTGFLQGQGKSDSAGIYNYCYQAPEQVKGRYVKVTMTFNTWAFIDEIQVFQVAETQRPTTANVLDENLWLWIPITLLMVRLMRLRGPLTAFVPIRAIN